MPTLMQKIRLALRGWSRRREERDREFVARSANWGGRQAILPVLPTRQAGLPVLQIDIEGLTVAYLDDSARIVYYLDVQSGDVIDVRDGSTRDASRFKRVPTSSPAEDRRVFISTLEDRGQQARLNAADSFRSALATDRALERAWFNFRSDRALEAIGQWLREIGLR